MSTSNPRIQKSNPIPKPVRNRHPFQSRISWTLIKRTAPTQLPTQTNAILVMAYFKLTLNACTIQYSTFHLVKMRCNCWPCLVFCDFARSVGRSARDGADTLGCVLHGRALHGSHSISLPNHSSQPTMEPEEPGISKLVHRCGAFLCSNEYCARYMIGTRGKGDIDTGASHVGFRCVKV